MCDKKTENHTKSTKRYKLHVILILNRWIVASTSSKHTKQPIDEPLFFFLHRNVCCKFDYVGRFNFQLKWNLWIKK